MIVGCNRIVRVSCGLCSCTISHLLQFLYDDQCKLQRKSPRDYRDISASELSWDFYPDFIAIAINLNICNDPLVPAISTISLYPVDLCGFVYSYNMIEQVIRMNFGLLILKINQSGLKHVTLRVSRPKGWPHKPCLKSTIDPIWTSSVFGTTFWCSIFQRQSKGGPDPWRI